MKTILEIAKELGVTKQAVYKRFKGKLYAEVFPFVHTKDNTTYIEEQGEAIIKQDFLKNDDISNGAYTNPKPHIQSKKDVHTDIVMDTLISIFQSELEVKNKQLEAKDKQIEELTATIRIQAESINLANKSELAETIIDGNKLMEKNNPKKNIFKKIFSRGQ